MNSGELKKHTVKEITPKKGEVLPEKNREFEIDIPSVRNIETPILNYDCPVCRSKSTKRTSLIWANGISNSSSQRTTVGLFSYRKMGAFGSHSWTGSKKQTKVSEMNEPPVFYGFASFSWTFIVFWILLPGLIGDLSRGICIAAAIYMAIHDIFYYPAQKDEWDESFFCNKCGAQYIPGGEVLNSVTGNDTKP